MFLAAGTAKLVSFAPVVATFTVIGAGQWLRYAVGAVEVIGALFLLVPSLMCLGAVLLIAVMLGAIVTDMVRLHRPPIASAIFLALLIVVARARY